ncbi:MAG: NAD-dependent epimerase/dehydratase family protein [Pseudomonadota bacterium]
MTKRVLLLGASGFIGKNLCEAIKKDIRYELLAPTRSELNLLDANACRMYLQHSQPDYVIHSAVNISSAEGSLQSFFNILNHRALFGHLIQIGSGAEYDRRICSPQVIEQDFGKSIPTDSYGLAKYLIARELNATCRDKVTNFRLFGVFGKHEDINRRFISNNIVRVLAGLPISINQDVVFDYIDVQDFCDFLVKILPRLPLEGVSYNFSADRPVSLSFLAHVIKSQMHVEQDIQIKNKDFGREYTGSSKKLFSEVDAYKFRPLEESIRDLICFYQKSMTEDMIQIFKDKSNA